MTSRTSSPATSSPSSQRIFEQLRTAWAVEGRTVAARRELTEWKARHTLLSPYSSPFDVTTTINRTNPEHADELLCVLFREAGTGSELARRCLFAALSPVAAGVYKRAYCPAWQREDFTASISMHTLRIITDMARDYNGTWPLRTFYNRLEHTARRITHQQFATATCEAVTALQEEITECERTINRSEEILRLLETAVETRTIKVTDAELLATKLVHGTPLKTTAKTRGLTERVLRYRYDAAMNLLISNREALVAYLAA